MNIKIEPDQIKMRQIHIKLPKLGLEDIVDDLAHAAYLTMVKHLDMTGTGDEDFIRVRDAIRSVLRKYVTAFDRCGMNSLCWKVEEFNPWLEDPPKLSPDEALR